MQPPMCWIVRRDYGDLSMGMQVKEEPKAGLSDTDCPTRWGRRCEQSVHRRCDPHRHLAESAAIVRVLQLTGARQSKGCV